MASPRTVLITGAAGNLGRAVAQAFAAQGDDLVLIDLHREHLQKTFGDETPTQVFVQANLLQAGDAQAAVETALAKFGRLDALCNLAGGFRMGEAVHETTPDTWNFLFDLNVRTVLNMSHAIVPKFIAAGGGKIVNVGAFSAQKGAARMGSYIASKASVIRLTESMAAELREKNINVNCVLPTIIDTPQNRADMPDADPAKWVAAGDLANVIAFLASDAARAVHGAALPVTGLS